MQVRKSPSTRHDETRNPMETAPEKVAHDPVDLPDSGLGLMLLVLLVLAVVAALAT